MLFLMFATYTLAESKSEIVSELSSLAIEQDYNIKKLRSDLEELKNYQLPIFEPKIGLGLNIEISSEGSLFLSQSSSLFAPPSFKNLLPSMNLLLSHTNEEFEINLVLFKDFSVDIKLFSFYLALFLNRKDLISSSDYLAMSLREPLNFGMLFRFKESFKFINLDFALAANLVDENIDQFLLSLASEFLLNSSLLSLKFNLFEEIKSNERRELRTSLNSDDRGVFSLEASLEIGKSSFIANYAQRFAVIKLENYGEALKLKTIPIFKLPQESSIILSLNLDLYYVNIRAGLFEAGKDFISSYAIDETIFSKYYISLVPDSGASFLELSMLEGVFSLDLAILRMIDNNETLSGILRSYFNYQQFSSVLDLSFSDSEFEMILNCKISGFNTLAKLVLPYSIKTFKLDGFLEYYIALFRDHLIDVRGDILIEDNNDETLLYIGYKNYSSPFAKEYIDSFSVGIDFYKNNILNNGKSDFNTMIELYKRIKFLDLSISSMLSLQSFKFGLLFNLKLLVSKYTEILFSIGNLEKKRISLYFVKQDFINERKRLNFKDEIEFKIEFCLKL